MANVFSFLFPDTSYSVVDAISEEVAVIDGSMRVKPVNNEPGYTATISSGPGAIGVVLVVEDDEEPDGYLYVSFKNATSGAAVGNHKKLSALSDGEQKREKKRLGISLHYSLKSAISALKGDRGGRRK